MGGVLGHYRLASLKAGDDVTLARYVRDHRGTAKVRKNQPRLPGMESGFIAEGRTKFSKAVRRIIEMPHLLVSGHSNVKIGRDVRKGKHRGYWIYTLSLEERKTCPPTCNHWQTCYGNNMPFAKRIDHTDPDFLPALEKEISSLCRKRRRTGVLIRLHALGDFYSVGYVSFWERMLREHANLAVFGYTARRGPIGLAVDMMNAIFGDRCMVRFSDGGFPTRSTVSIGDESSCPPNAFVCPEQTGKTRCCATCGACWSTNKNVAFMEH